VFFFFFFFLRVSWILFSHVWEEDTKKPHVTIKLNKEM